MSRRAKGEGSLLKIYGKKDPITGEKKPVSDIFYAQYRHHGKTVRVSTGETSKMKALHVLRRLMSERDGGSAVDSNKLRYADLRQMLIDNYREKENRTLTTDADGEETVHGLKQLDKFFGFTANNHGPRVYEITPQTSQEFARKRKAQGVGSAIINRGLACLRRMLRLAYNDKRIGHVPNIHFLKEPPARRGFVEEEKFYELLALLPTHLKPLILFLYRCAVRGNEARQIEWSQVNLDARLITLTEEQAKTDEERNLPLTSELVMLLRATEPKTGKVFDHTNLRVEWEKACAACELGTRTRVEPEKENGWTWYRYSGLSIHDLRRSGVRNLMRAGNTEKVVMAISGHKTRDVFDRYNIVSTKDVTAAMRRLELKTARISESLVKEETAVSKKKRASLRK
jgi:integrase